MNLAYPVPPNSIVTQTYAEHVARAKAHGWCYEPGYCPNGIYYYGGIDWGVPSATNVECALAGHVAVVRRDAQGYGYHVRVDSGKWLVIYAHLSAIYAQAGAEARLGDLIGLSGNTGNSTGPHLHFELRDKSTSDTGVPIDPMPYLTDAPEPPIDAPDFPELPRAVVTTTVPLNIRGGPGTEYSRIGQLRSGDSVEVIRIVQAGADEWAQIGYSQFSAMRYKGNKYMGWAG